MVSEPAEAAIRETAAAESAATWARIAPLEDEEMLGAVQRGLAEVVIPELRRLGADEFIVSQAKSIMSIVGFTRRGLFDRQAARATCNAAVADILDAPALPATTTTSSGAEVVDEIHQVVRRRLDRDIAGRIR